MYGILSGPASRRFCPAAGRIVVCVYRRHRRPRPFTALLLPMSPPGRAPRQRAAPPPPLPYRLAFFVRSASRAGSDSPNTLIGLALSADSRTNKRSQMSPHRLQTPPQMSQKTNATAHTRHSTHLANRMLYSRSPRWVCLCGTRAMKHQWRQMRHSPGGSGARRLHRSPLDENKDEARLYKPLAPRRGTATEQAVKEVWRW